MSYRNDSGVVWARSIQRQYQKKYRRNPGFIARWRLRRLRNR